jgi:hypothetical protein
MRVRRIDGRARGWIGSQGRDEPRPLPVGDGESVDRVTWSMRWREDRSGTAGRDEPRPSYTRDARSRARLGIAGKRSVCSRLQVGDAVHPFPANGTNHVHHRDLARALGCAYGMNLVPYLLARARRWMPVRGGDTTEVACCARSPSAALQKSVVHPLRESSTSSTSSTKTMMIGFSSGMRKAVLATPSPEATRIAMYEGRGKIYNCTCHGAVMTHCSDQLVSATGIRHFVAEGEISSS